LQLEDELLERDSYPGHGLMDLFDAARDSEPLDPDDLLDWQDGRKFRASELECLLRNVFDILHDSIDIWYEAVEADWTATAPASKPYGPQLIFIQGAQDEGFIALRRLEVVSLAKRERPFDMQAFVELFEAYAQYVLESYASVDFVLLGRDLADLTPAEFDTAVTSFQARDDVDDVDEGSLPDRPALVFNIRGRGGFRCLYPVDAENPRRTLGLFDEDY
jgi:hypothetical protein